MHATWLPFFRGSFTEFFPSLSIHFLTFLSLHFSQNNTFFLLKTLHKSHFLGIINTFYLIGFIIIVFYYKMKKANKNNVASKMMEGLEWEMRPGGMLVQKRNLDYSNKNSHFQIPIIKVLVKFGSSYHEIHVNSHATFGELKRMLVQPTRLKPQDQKLIFKDKLRDSRSFLDACGVKDGSKITLVQDIISQENRFLEARRNSNMERALKSVGEVTMEVDKLGSKVTTLESIICKGGRVIEKELITLIELLMAQMIKLDGIVADGDVKLTRKMQVMRIQKYIDNLDRLKERIAKENKHGGGHVGLIVSQQQSGQRNISSGQINLTTQWEKF